MHSENMKFHALVVEKIKTPILHLIHIFRKLYRLRDNVEKYGRDCQDARDLDIIVFCFLFLFLFFGFFVLVFWFILFYFIFVFFFGLLLHIVLNFSLKLCTT